MHIDRLSQNSVSVGFMQASYPTIKPPESLAEAISPIGVISDQEFERLSEAVSGPRSFSLSKEQIESLAKEIPTTAAVLQFTLGTLAYLYSQISRVIKDEESYSEVVAKLVDDFDKDAKWSADVKSKMTSRLTSLLSKKETHQRFKKLQRLQTGFLPNAIGFSSFVDIRPDYNDGTPTDIKGLVTIVQFRISTDSENPASQRLVVQMDEDGLAELKKAVDRVYEKVAVLKANPAISAYLIES